MPRTNRTQQQSRSKSLRQVLSTWWVNRPALAIAVLLALLAAVVFVVQGANRTWNNSGTNYNAAGSWTGGIPGTGDVALFNAARITDPNLASSLTNQELNFSTAASSGYILSSNNIGIKLTLTNTGTGGTGAINAANTSGMNIITAPLVLGASSASTQTFTQASGGTLALVGVIASTNSPTLSLAGAGTFSVAGANTYTGNTTLGSGNFILGNNAAFGTGTVTWNAGTTSATAGLSGASAIANTGTLATSGGAFNGTNNIELSGILTNTATTNTINNNISGGGSFTISNRLNLSNNGTARTVTFGGSGTTAITGVVANGTTSTSNLAKSGAGTLTLSGVNTHTGTTSVNGGTLALTGSGSLGNTSTITVAGGATFDVSAVASTVTLASSQTLSGTGTASAGTIKCSPAAGLTLGSSSPLNLSFANTVPTLSVTGGTLTLQSGNVVTVNVSGGPLGPGDYKVISKGSGGTVAGSAPTTVGATGSGVTAGNVPSLQIVAGELFLHVGAASALSGSYNVGAGEAITSLTKAGGLFSQINAGGLSGNVVVNITSDLTLEHGAVALNQWAETPAASDFTLTIHPSGSPRTISGTTANAMIKLNGADRVTLDGSTGGGTDRSLTINNTNNNGTMIWIGSASSSNGANNNTIKNCNLTGVSPSTTVAGIFGGSGTTLGDPAEAENSNNTIRNNQVTRAQNGVFIFGGATTLDQNWSVTGNTFGSATAASKLGFRGMFMANAQNFTINGNLIMGVTNGVSSAIDTGIQLDQNINGGSITGNTIRDIKQTNTEGWGCSGIWLNTTSTPAGVTIANNSISDVTGQGFGGISYQDNGYGIMITAGSGYNIFFNSINLNTNQGVGAGGGNSAAINIASAVTTTGAIDLRDNIVANMETTGTRYAIICAAPASVFSNIDYNDYFAQNVGFDGTIAVPGLSDWQAFSGNDLHSIAADPLFNSATNLQAQLGSPVLDAGVSLTGLVTPYVDILGAARVDPPTMGAFENGADAAAPVISYTPLGNTTSTASRTLSATITDSTGVPTSGAGRPVIYYRKGASGAFAATQSTFAGAGVYNFTLDYSQLTGGSASPGDTIQYYIVAEDTFTTPNVGSSPSAGAGGFTADPPAAATPPTTPNSYSISVAFAGPYSVCDGGTYPTLKSFFDAVNASVITGNVTINIGGTCAETARAVLNQWSEEPAGSNFTVLVQPAGGARTVSGNVSGALVKLNGADRVTIDGLNTGGKSLAVTNTSTNGSGLWVSSLGDGQGAANNTIRNLTITGGTNSAASTYGIAVSGATISADGADNDNVTVQGNSITKVFFGVFVGGTTGASAGGIDNLSISNNLIGPAAASGSTNIGAYGMWLENAVAPSVTGNTVRNVVNSSNASPGGILLNTNVAGAMISQNSVSGVTVTGNNSIAYGIINGAAGLNTTGTQIIGNTISNISATSAGNSNSAAVAMYAGSSGSQITGNTISGITNASTAGYPAWGVYVNTGMTGSNVTLANNSISDIVSYSDPDTTFRFQPVGLFIDDNTGGINLYFNSVNLALSHNGLGSPTIQTCLYVAGTASALDVRNNVFANSYDNTNSSSDRSYALFSNAPASAFSNINNNDYFASGAAGVLGSINGIDKFVLSDWQAATGQDANSIAADPLFIGASNLQPFSGSPLIGGGTPIAGITTDITGATRSATLPTIGAYETGFVSVGTLQFSAAAFSDTEGNSATITVNRVSGSTGAVSVDYATGAGTAVAGTCGAGGDYIDASGTLSWADGDATPKMFAVQLCTDAVTPESPETVSLTLSNVQGTTITGSNPATLTITDNTPGTVQFNAPTYSGPENTTATITVTRTGGTAGAVSLEYATGGGSAMGGAACGSGVDYISASGTLSWAQGDGTARTFDVTLCGDQPTEATETVNLTLSNVTGGAVIGVNNPAVLSIIDAPPSFCNNAPITINDSGPGTPYPSNISVSGLSGSVIDMKVTLKNLSHTYTSDIDVLLVGPGGQKFILFSDVGGNTTTNGQTFTIFDAAPALLGDGPLTGGSYKPTNKGTGDFFTSPAPGGPYSSPAPDGTATLNGVFGGTSPNGTWRLYVYDGFGSDSGSIADGWCLEITSGETVHFSAAAYNTTETSGLATINVDRTGTTGPISVSYATTPGNATPGASCGGGSDYVTTAGTLNFADGEASKSFDIPICDDAVFDGLKTVNLTLSDVVGGSIIGTPGTAVLNISDNETGPTISISGVTVNENAGSASFVVNQSFATTAITTFNYSTVDGTAHAGLDYTAATNAPATIGAGSTSTNVVIPITNDGGFEGTETFTVTISNAINATIAGATATGTINDDDTASLYTVNTLNNSNDGTCNATHCSLREAMNAANANPGIISFAPGLTGTITLSSPSQPLPPIQINMNIVGPGADLLTINANNVPSRTVFQVSSQTASVQISGLTITGGRNQDFGHAGAFENVGTLAISDCVITGNTGAEGGAITDIGNLSIRNTTISNNIGERLPIDGCNNNTGGVNLTEENAVATIVNSTISGNTANGCSLNSGGILIYTGTLTLTNSTVTNNVSSATLFAGAVGTGPANALITVRNSIIAGNSGNADIFGTFASQGFNLIGNADGVGAFTQPTDQAGSGSLPLDPMLGPLANNGGPSSTHLVGVGSPALDKGYSFGSTTDQRGFTRPADDPGFPNAVGGDGSDIGAYERDAGAPTATPTNTATSTPTSTATSTPTDTPTGTPSPTPTPACDPDNYTFTSGTGTIVPGTTDIGNHTDDGETSITLPFPVTLYGNTYTTANAGSNGYLSFGTFDNDFYSGCLPNSDFTYTIFPFATDQNTVPAGRGIFTATTGVAPNRTFYVDFRNCLYASSTTCVPGSNNRYEIVFQEGQSNFEVIYGTFGSPNNGVGAIGVQGAGFFTEAQCTVGRPASSMLTFDPSACPVVTPTPSETPTATSTATPTSTSTPTATPTGSPTCSAILFDQTNGITGTSTGSQDFEPGLDQYDDQIADDFVVPAGQTWNVQQVVARGIYFNGPGPAQSFNVTFYTDSSTLPGTAVAGGTVTGAMYSANGAGDTFTITLPTAVELAPGTYWVSVQARMDFSAGGQWGWEDSSLTSNSAAAWQNPGGAFGVGCTSWGRRGACIGDAPNPDQIFQIVGSSSIGCVMPSPTTAPTDTPTATATATPTADPCVPLSEGFDDITTLVAGGWSRQNHSTSGGTNSWFQGTGFPAHQGDPSAYIAATYQNTSDHGTISNWLLTPVQNLHDGDTLTFWTRSVGTSFPDRLQVRLSSSGASTNVGTSPTDVGDFTTLMLDINPTYTTTDYPNVWTQFTVTVSGLGSPTTGRLAFRYFVEDSGPAGSRGDYIGIDTVEFHSCTSTPTPTDTPTSTPTSTPTDTPTSTPTDTPTSTPTNTPTDIPTSTPTNTPTSTPTNTPTNTPTDTPTNTPTSTPTNTPTDTPTSTPTNTPTDTPTNTPTNTPTSTPTDTPTSTPTSTPTDTPTSTPTDTPTNTPTSTPTFTPTPPPSIAGTVKYGNDQIVGPSPRFVPNVFLEAFGSLQQSYTTGTDGTYLLTGFGPGAYTVMPTKSGGDGLAITSFDAARIAQYSAGMISFNAAQLSVADVSGNGGITSFDAGLVAAYAVGAPNTGSTGHWFFSPATRSYPSVDSSITGEDYAALLMGEVSGNWTSTGTRPVDSKELRSVVTEDTTSDSGTGPERGTVVTAPQLVTPADYEVIVPVSVEGAENKGIISYEFDLRYDPSVIQPQAYPVDLAGTVSSRLSVAVNAETSGLLKVAVYGPMPIDSSGVLMNLKFTAIGAAGSVSPLTWERIILNEGGPGTRVNDGQVELSAAAPDQAEVSGRLLTATGQGITNALVELTDTAGQTRSILSDGLGTYRFGGLQVGQTYTISVEAKRHAFRPMTVSITHQLASLDMIAEQ